MALTTLADVKAYLGIAPADTSQDVLIETFREATEQSIKNYCETDFASSIITNEVHDGIDCDVIVPKFFPVLSIQKVLFDGTELDSESYYFDSTGIVLIGVYTPFFRGSVRIDYTAGFSSVPADVKLAVYQTVKAEMQRKKNSTEGVASRSKDGESESFNAAWDAKSGLPTQIVSKLQSYRVYECPLIGMSQRNR